VNHPGSIRRPPHPANHPEHPQQDDFRTSCRVTGRNWGVQDVLLTTAEAKKVSGAGDQGPGMGGDLKPVP
jgi:hypothetical protein